MLIIHWLVNSIWLQEFGHCPLNGFGNLCRDAKELKIVKLIKGEHWYRKKYIFQMNNEETNTHQSAPVLTFTKGCLEIEVLFFFIV